MLKEHEQYTRKEMAVKLGLSKEHMIFYERKLNIKFKRANTVDEMITNARRKLT